MGTEVSTNVAPGLAGLAKGLKRVKTQLPSFGGRPYLKFGKDGEWSVGKNGDATNGEHAILNMTQLKSGYVCWTDYPKGKKNEKLGEEMALATLGSIDPSELPDTGWEWKQQMSIEGRFTSGDRQEFVYNTSSQGGLEALDNILDAVMERVEEGTVYVFPIVELNDAHYDHPNWGKTYKPVIDIVGWADQDGNPEGREQIAPPVAENDEQGEEEQSTKTGPYPTEEADEPPVRRRRR